MNKRCKLSLITTVLNGIYTVIMTVLTIMLFNIRGQAEDILDESGRIISEAGDHELTGGYEVLGGLGLGALGLVGVLVLFVTISVWIAVIVLMMISLIVGVCSQSNYKKGKPTKFKADAIIKLIFDGLAAGMFLFLITSSIGLWMLIGMIPLVVFVLSIGTLATKTE